MSKLSQKKRLRTKKHDNAIAALRASALTLVVEPAPPKSTPRIDELRRLLHGHQADLRLVFSVRRTMGIGCDMSRRQAKRRRDGAFPETIAEVSKQIRIIRAELAKAFLVTREPS